MLDEMETKCNWLSGALHKAIQEKHRQHRTYVEEMRKMQSTQDQSLRLYQSQMIRKIEFAHDHSKRLCNENRLLKCDLEYLKSEMRKMEAAQEQSQGLYEENKLLKCDLEYHQLELRKEESTQDRTQRLYEENRLLKCDLEYQRKELHQWAEKLERHEDKIEEIKQDFDQEVYDVVARSLLEINEHNASERYPISELWNLKEDKKASSKEVINHIPEYIEKMQASKTVTQVYLGNEMTEELQSMKILFSEIKEKNQMLDKMEIKCNWLSAALNKAVRENDKKHRTYIEGMRKLQSAQDQSLRLYQSQISKKCSLHRTSLKGFAKKLIVEM